MYSVTLQTFRDRTSIARNLVETKAKSIILRSFEQFISILAVKPDFPQVKLLQQFFQVSAPKGICLRIKKGQPNRQPLHI
ncbi:hypothetical protein TH44_21050 [Thalassospira xiamenensis]|jgi:hypothetical protein|uniref:Uncharacterized protein n=1 Tax=Thalassospira xiamenensis TaxID=220697 RepID=A0A367WYR2_9PROT|nr:hypothetical protein AUP41_20780 [Thalassospira xiamenensis]RCK45552.1 hypothetical protein TH44_21050 [Thalassospira xiamenensis]